MNKKKPLFRKKVLILGFGCLGKAIIPLLFNYLKLSPSQILIAAKDDKSSSFAKKFGLSVKKLKITKENYREFLNLSLSPGDFLLNLSTGISSLALIQYCQAHQILYLDTCTEPWEGLYTDSNLKTEQRTNYALREELLQYKEKDKTTAVMTHGANPGLVSHFVKQALMNLAKENFKEQPQPRSAKEWAALAHQLEIKTIQIAERDTQVQAHSKKPHEFVNTWSAEGLISEASQPAELGWGTHEKHWPDDACQHHFGSKCGIYINQPGARTKVKTWTPSFGSFNGYLITHAESLSIADYLTLSNQDEIYYRPSVYYAYYPCPDATLSLHELEGSEAFPPSDAYVILNEIIDGMDELGVLLMGNSKGAYWYGSQLTIQETRTLAEENNATSLQVVSSVIAAMIWAIENPNQGIVEPDEIDYKFILSEAKPFLGQVKGYYTSWNPLKTKNHLFSSDKIDPTDPWQFINLRTR